MRIEDIFKPSSVLIIGKQTDTLEMEILQEDMLIDVTSSVGEAFLKVRGGCYDVIFMFFLQLDIAPILDICTREKRDVPLILVGSTGETLDRLLDKFGNFVLLNQNKIKESLNEVLCRLQLQIAL